MDILLDTHMLVWFITDDPQLSEEAKDIIQNEDNTVYFSVLNLWEIELKKQLKSLLIKNDLCNFTLDLMDYGFDPLPYTPRQLYKLDTLKIKNKDIVHKDPFDNALLAQAKSAKAFLLTHDHCFKNYDEEYLIIV